MNQPVEDAISHGRIADLFMPPGHQQLRRENQRADLIAILTDLPEVTHEEEAHAIRSFE